MGFVWTFICFIPPGSKYYLLKQTLVCAAQQTPKRGLTEQAKFLMDMAWGRRAAVRKDV